LKSGVPIETPALTVNRLCGSGFEAIIVGSQQILLDDANVALVGGTESMSQAPFVVRDVRFGTKLGGDYKFEDSLWGALTDAYVKLPMAITAENLAEKHGISRKEADEFALSSQTKWTAAFKAGRFEAEIAPIELKSKKGVTSFVRDEHPRETNLEALAKLPPVFKKEGTVSAGNASGICDGAAALIVANEEAVKKYNLTPLARIISWASVGVDPSIMGIGPVNAIRKTLQRAKLELKNIDLFEVNEAFSTQFLAVAKELGLDREKTNTNGGAVALGHPLAASGARIMAHLTHELQRTKGRYAIGSACIGGGQGIAVLIERV
jgi:acetyl-CoA acyltransferase 2